MYLSLNQGWDFPALTGMFLRISSHGGLMCHFCRKSRFPDFSDFPEQSYHKGETSVCLKWWKSANQRSPPFDFGCFYPFFEGPLLIKSTPYDHVLTNSFWKPSFWEQNKSHFALPEAIPWFGPEILQVSKKFKNLTSIRLNLIKMTTDCQDLRFRFWVLLPVSNSVNTLIAPRMNSINSVNIFRLEERADRVQNGLTLSSQRTLSTRS